MEDTDRPLSQQPEHYSPIIFPFLCFYFQGQFVVDFITCFPWYAFWKLFVPKHNEDHSEEDHVYNNHMYHCALRMINVSQIVKLYAASWAESIGALRRVTKFSLNS